MGLEGLVEVVPVAFLGSPIESAIAQADEGAEEETLTDDELDEGIEPTKPHPCPEAPAAVSSEQRRYKICDLHSCESTLASVVPVAMYSILLTLPPPRQQVSAQVLGDAEPSCATECVPCYWCKGDPPEQKKSDPGRARAVPCEPRSTVDSEEAANQREEAREDRSHLACLDFLISC